MIFSVLTVFLTVMLGASSFILGIMEGIADFSASSLDYISGYLSDRTGKRKAFALFGYSFSTLAKMILVFVSSIPAVITFRVVERLGKSIRGAPRDALISTIAEKKKIGFAFGFHKTLDKAGAILGPIVAYGIITLLGQNLGSFQVVFRTAVIPALLSVCIMALFVREKPVQPATLSHAGFFSNYKFLGKPFQRYLKIAGFFSLAYFSFAFLLLKAYTAGFEIKDVVLLYALFNVSFTLISIPVGKIGDRIGRRAVIISEYILYALMCLGFIFATTKVEIIGLFLVYGIFYAIDEGQTKAFISDITEEKNRASAIGLYNFISGLMYLPASLLAGWLWNAYTPSAAFGTAGAIAVVAAVFFTFLQPKPEIHHAQSNPH